MRIQRQSETFTWRFAANYTSQQKKEKLEWFLDQLSEAGVDSKSLFGQEVTLSNGKKKHFYHPARQQQQKLINRFFYDTGGPENPHLHEPDHRGRVGASRVPQNLRAMFVAGLGGSGKTTLLQRLKNLTGGAISPEDHFISNADPQKVMAAHLGMVPTQQELVDALVEKGMDPALLADLPEFSPLDLNATVHEEMSDNNKLLFKKLMSEHRDVILDATLTGQKSALKTLAQMQDEGYNTDGILANASMGPAQSRVDNRYEEGHQKWTQGADDDDWNTPLIHKWFKDNGILNEGERIKSKGGRYVPKSVQNANAPDDLGRKRGDRSAAESVFDRITPYLGNALKLDADVDLKVPGNSPTIQTGKGTWFEQAGWDTSGRPVQGQLPLPPIPVKKTPDGESFTDIENIKKLLPAFGGGGGAAGQLQLPIPDGGIRPGGNQMSLPFLAFRRFANDEDPFAQIALERQGTVDDILDRYEAGEFDFPALAHGLMERAYILMDDVGDSEPDPRSAMVQAYSRAEEWDDDNFDGLIRSAEDRGVLSEEEAGYLVSLVMRVFGLNGVS